MVEITERIIPTLPQQDDAVIVVEKVSKKFCRDLRRSLLYGVQDIAADLGGWRRRSESLRQDEFWALKDVSFQLRRGEALGLVGTNGAGKSTILRIVSGLIKPDTGCVKIRGRLAPLIALGAGFNPILTGRENIYANMSILGLPTREIKKRFDDVVEFAEIWDAIDAPVQTYSSGMAARLGFACAIYTEPEILLIDEVLAVGDTRFKAKCYRRLYELRQKGTSFILVNHSTQAILNTCDSAIYLSKGQLIASGDVETIMAQYEKDLFLNTTEQFPNQLTLPPKLKGESLGLDLTYLCFKDDQGKSLESLVVSEPTNLCIGCHAQSQFNNVTFHIRISKVGGEESTGSVLFFCNSNDDVVIDVPPGRHEIQLQMPYLGLEPGTYSMKIQLKKDSVYVFDVVESFRFTILSNGRMNKCKFYQPRTWKFMSYIATHKA